MIMGGVRLISHLTLKSDYSEKELEICCSCATASETLLLYTLTISDGFEGSNGRVRGVGDAGGFGYEPQVNSLRINPKGW